MSEDFKPRWVSRKAKDKTPKGKSLKQEAKSAREMMGRTTIGSGNLPFDKADVFVKRYVDTHEINEYRIEAKRTDKESIDIKKEWLIKLRSQAMPKECIAVEIEIQDETWALIPKDDFRFLVWLVTAPKAEVRKMFEDI